MARKSKKEIEELLENEVPSDDDATEVIEEDDSAGPDLSKINLMSVMTKKIAGMSSDDMIRFYNEVMAQDGNTFSGVIPNNAAQINQASVAMKGAIKEDLELVFGGDKTLTEEFKERMSTIFESAVNTRVSLLEAELQEAYAEALEEQVSTITESLIENVDSYLEYIAEEWMKENQVAIESSVRAEIAEEFMTGLKNLFIESYIDIPDARIDAVEMLATKVDELEEKLNESINSQIEVIAENEELKKHFLITEASEGLTLTDKEKLRTLAESVDFESEEVFTKKLKTIKESHLKLKPKAASNLVLNESIGTELEENDEILIESVDPEIVKISKAISRTSRE